MSDPTIEPEYPPLTADDDPEGDYWDKVYDQGFTDGYAIGRYESHLSE